MNSRINSSRGGKSGKLSPGGAGRLFGAGKRILVMKGAGRKISNNEKRNHLTTSYSTTTNSIFNNRSTSKITKKRTKFTPKSFRLLSLTKPHHQPPFTLECEEDLNASPAACPDISAVTVSSTFQHLPKPFPTTPQTKQELVNDIYDHYGEFNMESQICDQISLSQDNASLFTLSENTTNTNTTTNTIVVPSPAVSPAAVVERKMMMMEEDDGQQQQHEEDVFQLFSENISREVNNSSHLSAGAGGGGSQNIVKPFHRRTLIDWLNALCEELHLPREVFYHSVSILDRSLCMIEKEGYYKVDCNNLQVFGSTCVFIASKYHGRSVMLADISPPAVSSNQDDSKDQIVKMESVILNSLDFQLRSVLLIDYINLFIHSMKNDQSFIQEFPSLEQAQDFIDCIELVSNYVCEAQVHNHEMLGYRPSVVALSCFVLTFQLVSPQSNFQSIPLFRKFLKIYAASPIVDGGHDENIDQINQCVKKCFNSIKVLEAFNLKLLNSNKDPIYSISKHHATVSTLIHHPETLIELDIQDLQH